MVIRDDPLHPRPPMTIPEAAAILGVKPSTLRAQIRNRKLTAVKVGRDWQVDAAEVERYAAENRRVIA